VAEQLLSVGLDVGTTSTQMVLSRLTVENKASAFAVPALEISRREVLYKSNVHFTPLLSHNRVDGEKLRGLVEEEYRRAGITPEDVDTGAIIITGETSRKENARTALQALSDYAGDFVVATAGPDLESALAAKGAGAVEYSRRCPKPLLHLDIGGGTSNLALIRDGEILRTGCMNVGGRLVRLTQTGKLCYVSPVVEPIFPFRPGDQPPLSELEELARKLTQALEMAAGLRPPGELLSLLMTREATPWSIPEEEVVISFSGGVADCIDTMRPPLQFGDLGPTLGQCIRSSALCAGSYRLGEETIRATVIGAGSHSTQLSGSTVFYRNVQLPLKNLSVISITEAQQTSSLAPLLLRRCQAAENDPVVAIPGLPSPSYGQVKALAEELALGIKGPIYVCVEKDMAKALGQALAAITGPDRPILCLDRIRLKENSYLDVGQCVGSALPVVVKTLVLER